MVRSRASKHRNGEDIALSHTRTSVVFFDAFMSKTGSGMIPVSSGFSSSWKGKQLFQRLTTIGVGFGILKFDLTMLLDLKWIFGRPEELLRKTYEAP